MRQPEIAIAFIEKGKTMPGSCLSLVEEARQSMVGLADLQGQPYAPGRAGLDGTMDLIFLLYGEEPAGLMSYEVKEDDVQMFYCRVRDDYKAFERRFFAMAVDHFRSVGMQVVRTNFRWPSPERCIEAARDMGFIMVERIEMARESDPGYPLKSLPAGVELVPWSEGLLDEAARLLLENGNEIDRQIYPQEQTFAGARSQLKKITGNMYGGFLADQSMIARAGGETIGMLLATEYDGASVLLSEIVVDRDHRGLGIASAMIGRLIRGVASRGDRRITLAVNGQNADAIRLYERKGFRPLSVFRQYVLPVRRQPEDAASSRTS